MHNNCGGISLSIFSQFYLFSLYILEVIFKAVVFYNMVAIAQYLHAVLPVSYRYIVYVIHFYTTATVINPAHSV